jgi:hypothetical protein
MIVTLSDNTNYTARAEIWEDLSEESTRTLYRAFWVKPGTSCGVPVVGYLTAGASFTTIKACAADFHKRFPGEKIYRNERLVE